MISISFFRYDQGPNSVSIAQIPAESDDRPDIMPLKTIAHSRDSDELGSTQFSLESHSVDKNCGRVDPLKWFGILVPQSLKTAKERYDKSIELVIESSNVEQKLRKNMELIAKLKNIKSQFETTEE